jgi:hypothetical protein
MIPVINMRSSDGHEIHRLLSFLDTLARLTYSFVRLGRRGVATSSLAVGEIELETRWSSETIVTIDCPALKTKVK